MVRTSIAIAAFVLASGVHAQNQPNDRLRQQWNLVPGPDLSAMLDCHEAAGTTLVSAHRGGPSPGLPENAIPTMDAVLAAIPAIMEVDVARSPDGVHYLMHDATIDRTTTGSGAVSDTPWSAIASLRLVDAAGWATPYGVPTLREALEWARGRTVLQIDFKDSADEAEVIALIRETGNAGNVILIAYTTAAAARLHALAPEMLISASIDSDGDLARMIEGGVPADRIVAFTGTRMPRPDLYEALDAADVEVIFGTLGRSPGSLDNVIARFGTGERYAELGEGGVDIIATDRPREANAALDQAGRAAQAGQCGVTRALASASAAAPTR